MKKIKKYRRLTVIRGLYGFDFYDFCITLLYISMICCLVLYLYLSDEKISNLFGNAFAGCVTGLIVFILGNIRQREISYYDYVIKMYGHAQYAAKKTMEDITTFIGMYAFDVSDVKKVYNSIDTFFFIITRYSDIYEYCKYDSDYILKEMDYTHYDFTEFEDREAYLKKVEWFEGEIVRIRIAIDKRIRDLENEKSDFEEDVL